MAEGALPSYEEAISMPSETPSFALSSQLEIQPINDYTVVAQNTTNTDKLVSNISAFFQTLRWCIRHDSAFYALILQPINFMICVFIYHVFYSKDTQTQLIIIILFAFWGSSFFYLQHLFFRLWMEEFNRQFREALVMQYLKRTMK